MSSPFNRGHTTSSYFQGRPVEIVEIPDAITGSPAQEEVIPLVTIVGARAVGKTAVMQSVELLDRSIQPLSEPQLSLSLYEARGFVRESTYRDAARLGRLGVRGPIAALVMEPAKWHQLFIERFRDTEPRLRDMAARADLEEMELLLNTPEIHWVENEYGDPTIAAGKIINIIDGRPTHHDAVRIAERLRTTIQTLG